MVRVCYYDHDVIDCLKKKEEFRFGAGYTNVFLFVEGLGPDDAKRIARAMEGDGCRVEVLNITDNQIGEEGCKAIADVVGNCPALTTLNISGNQIGEEGCKAIADVVGNCPALKVLDISGNQIGEEGCKAIADVVGSCPALTMLGIASNSIGLGGLRALCASAMSRLEKLMLAFCGIDDDGAALIADTLATSSSIAKIFLFGNNITDKGARALLAALDSNKTVSEIGLDNNDISTPLLDTIENRLRSEKAERRKAHANAKKARAAQAPSPASSSSASATASPAAAPSTPSIARPGGSPQPSRSDATTTLTVIDDLRARLDDLLGQIRGGDKSDTTLDERTTVLRALKTRIDETVADLQAESAALAAADEAHETIRERVDEAGDAVKKAKARVRQARNAVEEAEDEDKNNVDPQLYADFRAAKKDLSRAMAAFDRLVWEAAHAHGQYFPELEVSQTALVPGMAPCSRDKELSYVDLVRMDTNSRHNVYKGEFNGEPIVLKEYHDDGPGGPHRKCVVSEVRALQRLGEAPGVVHVNAVFVQKKMIYVEMPRYKYAGLLAWRDAVKPNESAMRVVAQKLLMALDRIHAVGIVHCDIKPDNVFVDENWRPVIGDFDVSHDKAGRTQTLVTQTRSFGGTVGFAAPEVMERGEVTFKSDIYSMGKTLREMFEGSPSSAIAGLLDRMTSAKPENRPTAGAAAQDGCFDAMPRDFSAVPPLYWNMSRLDGMEVRRVNVTDEMKDMLQGVLDKSLISLGSGRNIPYNHPPYSRLEIVTVERIESSLLWKRYATFCDILAHKLVDVPKIATSLSIPGAELRDGINEKYLLHGTAWPLVSKISRDGFDMRLGSGFFGHGTYFAEDSKADQYVVGNASAHYPLFLARVALGHASITFDGRADAVRPPCVEGHYGTSCDHARADSILAECTRTSGRPCHVPTHREFVVFDLHQAYPEYLITYRRV